MSRIPRMANILIVSAGVALFSAAQTHAPRPQTARQALIEMITHGGDAISKHLTVEVQDLLKSGGNRQLLGMYMASVKPETGLETFDNGDILFAYTDPSKKERYEVHVDNEDLSADEDALLLSLHTFREGKEVDNSFVLSASRFTVSMKLQQNIWRLNRVSVEVEVPVGDPEFIKKTMNAGAAGMGATAGGFYTPNASTQIQFDPISVTAQPEQIAVPPQQIVSLLNIAEHSFATLHPETGFTCSLKDLAETAKIMGVDEQVSTGSFNGYHFALSGCEGMPAGSFQIIAEPLIAKGAKAYCTDATANIRVSEDGRGATCLTSGKVQQEATEEDRMVGFGLPTGETRSPK